jgi:hypothetical protein
MPIPKKTPAVKKSAKPAVSPPTRSSRQVRSAAKTVVKRPLLPTQATAKAAGGAAVHVILDKPVKAKKPKLVRDSFTIPKLEYSVLEELKQRAGQLRSPAKKSELLRAGIKALAAMSDAALLVALQAVPAIKTGRPAKA